MAQVINLNDYKATKQRQLVINIYQFLNESLDYSLDNILIDFDESFIDVCNQYNLNPVNVNYFRLPIITFIVTSFIRNSDVGDYFPDSLIIENEENKYMFKNTLIKILETFEKNYLNHSYKFMVEKEIACIIDEGQKRLLEIIPENIYLV
ncbi:hypothetical protein SAMN05446037_102452 [Anaerovirgula multivorans]|uniref:Uncharacterized protein n=1 Tax=Anaerovirgula multivorans TaxID=312168 RepID=A0A239HXP6_9FIRM|nr:hypothetical protein [Anaerovirgula multivorans]SNS86045.1 hypothetical protein SAMN05446037_102452 [Anaerovirgula multivorans]